MGELSLAVLLAGVLAGAAPLVLAVMGETVTERAGLINLSLDGTILLSAMGAFATAYETESLAAGFAAGALVGAAVAAAVAVCSVYWRLSQVAVGFVLTLMCRDLAYFLGNPFSRLPGPHAGPWAVPFLEDLPWAGEVLFRQSLPVYGSLLLVGLTWLYLYRTRWGLELRSVGEHPRAAYARGMNVRRLQFFYAVWGGVLTGLAGAAFSLCVKPGWGRPQGAEGMGWIALAIVIFGGWHPLKAALGAYLFAFLQVTGVSLQGIWPSAPAQVFQTAPFPLMIFTLVLVHWTRKGRLRRWAEGRRWIGPLARFLHVSPPRALGKSLPG